MRTIAVLVLALGACFPHNATHRRYAKIGEGAAVVTGIAMQFMANADSCMAPRPGTLGQDCEEGHFDTVGLALIFAGLAGFAATMITSPEMTSEQP